MNPLRPAARRAAQGQVIIMMMVIPRVSLPSIGVRTTRQPGPSQCEQLNMKIWPPAHIRSRVWDPYLFCLIHDPMQYGESEIRGNSAELERISRRQIQVTVLKDVILYVTAIKMELENSKYANFGGHWIFRHVCPIQRIQHSCSRVNATLILEKYDSSGAKMHQESTPSSGIFPLWERNAPSFIFIPFPKLILRYCTFIPVKLNCQPCIFIPFHN